MPISSVDGQCSSSFAVVNPFLGVFLVFGGFFCVADFREEFAEECEEDAMEDKDVVHPFLEDAACVHGFAFGQFCASERQDIGIQGE